MDAEEETKDPRKMCPTCQRDDWGAEEIEPEQPGRGSQHLQVKLFRVHTGAHIKKKSEQDRATKSTPSMSLVPLETL